MANKYTAEEFRARFLDRVGPPDERGCHPWLGNVDRDGYGRVCCYGKVRRASHVALELYDGLPVEPGTVVMHSCDNPPCCEPTHLRRGTPDENVADRHTKGRDARGDNHGSRRHPETRPSGDANGMRKHPGAVSRGVEHGRAKLTETDVAAIRSAADSGESLRSLGAYYKVSDVNIGDIVHRRTWRHI